MTTSTILVKAEKTDLSPDEIQEIENQKKAAKHHEEAARQHYEEAAKHQEAGEHEKAAQSTIKAQEHLNHANEAARENTMLRKNKQ